jgi:hypothetical protein
MPGALFQLVSTGAEDIYIIGKPIITMFKCVYRRHQDFSIYDIIKIPKAKNTFGIDFQTELERSGDLLHKVYLIVDLPDLNLKNPPPTCANIKKILLEYGIIWNTSVVLSYNVIVDNCPNIITLDTYNNTIINVINDYIKKYINLYNFYSNANILSTNSDYLKTSSMDSINRNLNGVFDYVYLTGEGSINYAQWGDYIKNLYLNINQNLLTNGIVGSLMLSSKMMTKYSQEYLPIYSSQFLPNLAKNKYSISVDAYGTKKKNVVLYNDEFRNGYNTDNSNINIFFNTGAVLGFLLNYYYDTFFVNLNPNTSELSHSYIKLSDSSYFISNSLFGEIFNRPPNTFKNQNVNFELYDFDDIKYIYYISLLYNSTRLKFEPLPGPYNFYLDKQSIYIGDVTPPLNEPTLLGLYNPYISFISENIIYYHLLNPNTTSYIIGESLIGQNISIYFNQLIFNTYNKYNLYSSVFPFYNGVKFSVLDSYFIMSNYIAEIFSSKNYSDTVVKNSNQVQKIAESILYAIQYNIQYNLALFRNMINVIYNSLYTNSNHYRFSYFKTYNKSGKSTFTQSSITNKKKTTFGNNYQDISSSSYSSNYGDNFEYNIRNNMSIIGPLTTENIPTSTPGGADITNYFSNIIHTSIQNFRTACSNNLLYFENLQYMSDYTLWQRGVFDLGNQIQKTYLAYVTPENPQYNSSDSNSFSNEYKRNAIMNYIPFLAARDIPALVYYIFSTSIRARNIFKVLGSNFLSDIDYRDDGDDGAPLLDPIKKNTKFNIYQEMIQGIISPTTNLIDRDHYNALIDINSPNTNNFLLSNTLRPEMLFSEYSNIDLNSGNLSSNGSNISYLPIEWLSQTYYVLFENIINNFFIGKQEYVTIDSINKSINSDNLISTLDKSNTVYTNIEVPSGIVNVKQEFLLILQSIINSFVGYSTQNFPNYTTYINNGYVLLGLTPETSLVNAKYYIRSAIDTYTIPKFSDVTSTIWYQLQKNYIFNYNQLFNNTIISDSYYNNNIGVLMVDLFDKFKYTVNGERDSIFYYSQENIASEEANLLGSINFTSDKKSITVVINTSVFGNVNIEENFEERISIQFNSPNQILNNYIIDVNINKRLNYSETITIPENSTTCTVSYINYPGYQIYLNVLLFLNDDDKYYTINDNNYSGRIMQSWTNFPQSSNSLPTGSNGKLIEPFSPINLDSNGNVNENGFDFYRLRNLGTINSYTGKTKYSEIIDYVQDNITIYNFNLKFYNDNSSILNFINDTDIVYYDGTTEITKNPADYFYEQSYVICQYLNNHIKYKYIDPLPLSNDYNDISTITQNSYHQISDQIPSFTQQNLNFSSNNNDVIGFAFQLPVNFQSNYSIGFYVGNYPYPYGYVQLKKEGGDFYLSVSNQYNENKIKISITPSLDTIYYAFQYNSPQSLIFNGNNFDFSTGPKFELYENNNLIAVIYTYYNTNDNSYHDYLTASGQFDIDISPSYYYQFSQYALDNLSLLITDQANITIFDLYTTYSKQYTTPKNIIKNFVKKWFYIGLNINTNNLPTILYSYNPDLINIQQILNTVYYSNNESVSINKLTNNISTKTSKIHPFGQAVFSPVIFNTDDIIGFSFQFMNLSGIFGVGIYTNNATTNNIGKITVNNDGSVNLKYNSSSYIYLQSTTNFNPTEAKLYYFFYYNSSTHDPKFTICEYDQSNDNLVSFNISYSDIFSIGGNDFVTSLQNNISLYATGEIFARFYMDRYAYYPFQPNTTIPSNFQIIQNLMKNVNIWYYIGGTYSSPYNPDLLNIQNVAMTTKIVNLDGLISTSPKNIVSQINIGKFNYNDIVFPGGDNIL